ncbi:exodeoxyribonuclease VII large subunit [Pyruvatibacter mobilis]|uniref:exodeoxyribonuclease VII large subunit n=1 Tax=Pyruvatibacter mobilis TaxID=1712261 RepID=UPI003BAE231C
MAPTPDQDPALGNTPEFSVSELSGAVKRMVEDQFGHVRVRGEIGRVSRPASGHVYLDLKDDRAVLSGVIWKGNAARLQTKPEQGLEVIATGRLTTFPGQSKYQIVIESIEPAGVGALMKLLEDRRKALAAEGLFDADRKKPLPFLPKVIGVVTSPSGAVIRDILHRLRDRFPRHVLIWPTRVQGETAAAEVAAGIRGFNALEPGGAIRRPDLIIVARGGGSVEDLWPFNEEVVVRATADSAIPLISAVGHETDTTLIDFASDLRAPTPTAAAEHAVPVRADLLAQVMDLGTRQHRIISRRVEQARSDVRSLARALPKPERLLDMQRQRLDMAGEKLTALKARGFERHRARLTTLDARLSARSPEAQVTASRRQLDGLAQRLTRRRATATETARRALEPVAARLPRLFTNQVVRARRRLDQSTRLLETLSHKSVLERGFALALDASGRPIRSADAARAEGRFALEFAGADRVTVETVDGPPPERPAKKPAQKAAPKKQAIKKQATRASGGKGQGELF